MRPPFRADIYNVTFRQLLHGVLLLAVAFMISGTTGDPDLWGHVRFGLDMFSHGAIRVADTYSFTADRAWINHEWLAELLMAAAFKLFGAAGLNLLRVAVIGCVLGLVWRGLSRVSDRLRIFLFSACAIGIYMRAHPIRPQLFSLLLFAILVLLLQRADARRSVRPLMWVPIVMAVWVNLHGGWVVGLGYFGLWCVMRAVTGSARDRVALAAALAMALASTLVNPYGFRMWELLAGTIRLERPMIADWQPLYALPPLIWISWLTACSVLVIAAAHARSREDWIHVAMVAVLGALAVRVSRIDAFFALAAVFAAASVTAKPERAAAGSKPLEASPAFAIAFALCVLAAAVALVPRVFTVRVPNGLMPDSEVAAYARGQKLHGDVLTWFDWGEYLIWHFGPELKVSIDGRRETVYSAELVDGHMRFYSGTDDQWRYPDTLKADYVWIPKQLPVVRELRLHGWRPLCEGELSILLTRTSDTRQCSQQPATRVREFPEL